MCVNSIIFTFRWIDLPPISHLNISPHQTHVLLEVDRKFGGDGSKRLMLPHHAVSLPN